MPCSAWALQEAGRKVLAACHQLGMDKSSEGADSVSALLLAGLVFCIISSAAVEASQQPSQQDGSHPPPLALTLPEALAALGHLVQQLPDYTAQLQQLLGEGAWEELSLADVVIGDPETGCDLPQRRKVWPAFPEPFQRFLVERLEMLAGFLRKPHFLSLSGQVAACSGLNPDVHSCQLKL
jgi:hypothetical protein